VPARGSLQGGPHTPQSRSTSRGFTLHPIPPPPLLLLLVPTDEPGFERRSLGIFTSSAGADERNGRPFREVARTIPGMHCIVNAVRSPAAAAL